MSALVTLGIAVLTNAIIAVVILFVWMCIRRKYPRVYKPRMFISRFKVKPPHPGDTFFGWFAPTYNYFIQDIGLHCGPDQFVILRVLHFSVILFAVLGIFNLFVVLPINCIGDNDGVSGLDIMSMSNIEEKSDYLYAHMVAVFVSFFIFVKFMIALWNEMLDVRVKWLENNVSTNVHSVLLLDIPKRMNNEKALKETFDRMFPVRWRVAFWLEILLKRIKFSL